MPREYVDRELVEDQAEREWTRDAALREEFRGDKRAWKAYRLAEAGGRTQIHGSGNAIRARSLEAPARAAVARGEGGLTESAPRIGRVVSTQADHLAAFREFAEGTGKMPVAAEWIALSDDERPRARELVREGLTSWR